MGAPFGRPSATVLGGRGAGAVARSRCERADRGLGLCALMQAQTAGIVVPRGCEPCVCFGFNIWCMLATAQVAALGLTGCLGGAANCNWRGFAARIFVSSFSSSSKEVF